MNLRDVMVALAGGAMVYGAMAACTGGETARGAHAGDGAAGAGACECGPRELEVQTIECGDETGDAVFPYPGVSLDEIATSVTVLVKEKAFMDSYRISQHSQFLDEKLVTSCPANGIVRAVRVRE